MDLLPLISPDKYKSIYILIFLEFFIMADQEIVNSFKEALNSVFGGNSSTMGGNKNPASSTLDVSKITQSLMNLSQSIVPVITGFNNLSNSTTAFSDTMKAAASKLPIGGGAVKTIIEGRELSNEAGKQGLANNSFTALNHQAAQAGMTIEQYAKTMRDAEGRLQGFGRNASVAGENFSDTVNRALEGPLGQQMIVAGINTNEIAKSTAVMGMATKANMSDAKERQKLADATAAFTIQIDETARLTGKSRESIINEIDTRLKSVDSQLDLQLMTEEQRAQYAKTQEQLAIVGPTIQNAAANIASGTRLTEDTKKTLIALGPAGDEFQRAIAAQQNATTAAEKQAADSALEKAKADILAYTSSYEYAYAAKNGTTELQAHMKTMKGDVIAVENQRRAAKQEAEFTGKDPTKAIEAAKAEVIQNQQLKDAQGRQLEGAVVMGELNKSAEGMRKTSVGAAGALDTLNKELGKTPERLKPVSDILKSLGDFNKTSDQNRKNFEDLKNIIKPTTETKPTPTAVPTESNGVGIKPSDIVPGTPLEKRHTGSFGKKGTDIEDFGENTPMLLGGKETVMTEGRYNEMVMKPNEVLSQLPKMFSSMTESVGNIDFSKQLESLKGQLSTEPSKENDLPSQFESLKGELVSQLSPKDNTSIADQFESLKGELVSQTSKFTEFNPPDMFNIAPQITALIEKIKPVEQKPEPVIEKPPVKEQTDTESKPVTIKDLHDVMSDVNKNIMRMVNHTQSISDSSDKAARYASESTGSRI
jgi:hypothetical protein